MLIKIELNKFSNVRDQTRLLQKKDRMILFLIERTTPHIVNKMYMGKLSIIILTMTVGKSLLSGQDTLIIVSYPYETRLFFGLIM